MTDAAVSTTNDETSDETNAERFTDEHEQGIAVSTLHRDLLEVFRGAVRMLPEQWERCSPLVQSDTIDRASIAIEKAVRATVRLLAGELRASIDVEIESVAFGEKIKISLTASKGAEYRHQIADAAKSGALLVLPAYPARYSSRASDNAKPPEPEKDTKTADMFDAGAPTNGESEGSDTTDEGGEAVVTGVVTGDGSGEALPPIDEAGEADDTVVRFE